MKIFNVSIQIDSESFHALNWRVFFLCVGIGFLLALLQNVGLSRRFVNLQLLSPVSSESSNDHFAAIRPKLEKKANMFSPFKKTSFIPRSLASGEHEEASSYIVVDYDSGEILASKNDSAPLPVASLTKVMTAIVALDLADTTERFTATRQAASQIPTKIGLVPGQRLTLDELLHALLLTSANDAAEMIEEGINAKYSDDIFVSAMNAKADFLGLRSTRFDNPQGFDGKGNYSSVRDLSVLTHYALVNYPQIAAIVSKDYQFLPKDSYHKQYDLYNWNGLLGVYPDVVGLKIGNTQAAGKTTIVVSKRGGKTLIAVLLGAPDVLERDVWAAHLLDVGFAESIGLTPVGITKQQLKDKYKTWKYFQ